MCGDSHVVAWSHAISQSDAHGGRRQAIPSYATSDVTAATW
jgi:hypothetical protein